MVDVDSQNNGTAVNVFQTSQWKAGFKISTSSQLVGSHFVLASKVFGGFMIENYFFPSYLFLFIFLLILYLKSIKLILMGFFFFFLYAVIVNMGLHFLRKRKYDELKFFFLVV